MTNKWAVFSSHKNQNVFLLFFFLLFLSGCVGPRTVNKWVDEHYNSTLPTTKKKSDFVSVTSNIAPMGQQLSNTTKKTTNFLPLLFYWQWDYVNTCTLNPQIPVNQFTTTVLNYANKGLKQKLAGQRVEFSIEQLPNIFAIHDQSHMIWVIYTISWEHISIQPNSTEMVVSYKVLNDQNTVTKNGTITVTNEIKQKDLKLFRSLKKTTWQYLDDYTTSITSMSKKAVDKLVAEL